jgi:predicted MFS family arabinose efflux permease
MKILRVFTFLLPRARLNKSLRILIITNATIWFVVGMFAPFYAVFVEHVIDANIAFAGFSWAIFSIIAGVLTLLFSNWELRVREQELLLALGYVTHGVVFLSYAFMDSIPQLLFTQVLWGIAYAIQVPAFDALYSAHTESGQSIGEWAEWEGIAAISIGVAALIGGVLIQSFGYSVVFFTMSLISFGLGVFIWQLPREAL